MVDDCKERIEMMIRHEDVRGNEDEDEGENEDEKENVNVNVNEGGEGREHGGCSQVNDLGYQTIHSHIY